MKAAVFVERNKPFEVREYPLLEPGAGMASLRLETSGLCGTDMHIWEGALAFQGPLIIGHEFLGRVHALGTGEHVDCLGEPLQVGDRAAVNVIEACGECPLCTSGGAASCIHLGETLTYLRSPEEAPHFHGGFAEASMAPIRFLHKLPASLPSDVAASFLCAGPTVVRGVAYAGGFRTGEPVIVQGAGPVGLFAVLYAKALGAGPVIMIGSGSHPLRLDLARELGADAVLDIRTTSTEERKDMVMSMTGGLGAECIIEATGNPSAVSEGLTLLRLRGRYVWAGQYSDRGPIAFPTHLVTFNALQIFGSAQYTAMDRAEFFEFLTRVPEKWDAIRRVVTDRFTIDQVNEAFARAQSGSAIKILFVEG